MAQKFISYGGKIVADGGSLKLFSQNITPTNVLPGAPTIDSISGGSEQALIYYTTGTTGTNPIIDYEYSLNSGSTWVSLSSTNNPLTVTGLTNGTTYYIQIRPITHRSWLGNPCRTTI